MEPTIVDGICNACSAKAKYVSKAGKLWCEPVPARCSGVIEKRQAKLSEIGDDGLSGFDRRRKAIVNSMGVIGLDGLNTWQRNNRLTASSPTRNAKISTAMRDIMSSGEASRRSSMGARKRASDVVDGKDGNIRLAEKAAETRKNTVLDDGRTLAQAAAAKAIATMKTTLDVNGVSILEKRSRKIAEAIFQVGDDNLTPIERGRLRCLKMRHHQTGVPYQGKLERAFLDHMVTIHGLKWASDNIKRGPVFSYFDKSKGKFRKYFSDFIMDGVIVEVKSPYWWYRFEEENICKVEAVVSAGYQCFVFMSQSRPELVKSSDIKKRGP